MSGHTTQQGRSDGDESSRRTARGVGRYAVAAAVVVGLIAAAVAPAAAAQDGDGTEQALVVDVHEDGSATVTLTLTYDLTTQNETESFESLRGDEAAQTEFRDRFRDRMASVAADAENATGREMSVRDASISLATTDSGDTGIVKLSVVYEGLAAAQDGRLVVTEPFASGYVTNNAFVLRAPDGYELTSVTPEPASRQATTAAWNSNTDLTGFEAVFQPAETTTTAAPTETTGGESGGESGGGAPGFGVLAALAAAGAALAVRARP
ncbi:MAG: DUF4897 domain-containing protein [Halobacterium sp.]